MAYERKCIVDATEYKYCNKCGHYNSDETWRFIFCGENCRKIYKVMERFVNKSITELEAQELLKECDLSNKEHFEKDIKDNLRKVYAVSAVKVQPQNAESEKINVPKKFVDERKKKRIAKIDE